jgi:hypothetical protein
MIPVEVFYIFSMLFILKYIFNVSRTFLTLTIVFLIFVDVFIENAFVFLIKLACLIGISLFLRIDILRITPYLNNF